MKILVTGGAGFIGSAVIRHIIADTEDEVVNVDKLTYAGNLESLVEVAGNSRYNFECVDICGQADLDRVFAQHEPDAVMHLAAESHVDRSIDGPALFIETNLIGTYTLLEASRRYWSKLSESRKRRFLFHQISTDEVYGDLGRVSAACSEDVPYAPSSPYAASKAGADHLVRAWQRTYGLPALITNCSNNYGPCQFPEKLIPLMILNALDGRPLPIYGDGLQVRDWLYVEDHARALHAVVTRAQSGMTYNIGGRNEIKNIDVVHAVCQLLDELAPSRFSPYANLIVHVPDRPGHDRRYAIDASKIERDLGWRPVESFETGIRKTVQWYLGNLEWCRHVQDGTYRRERLGLAHAEVTK